MLLLRSLGESHVELNGVQQAVTVKGYLLLLYLKYQNKYITRRDLARILWPKSAAAAARHSLSQLLYSIGAKFPELYFIRKGDAVRLEGEIEADVNLLMIAADKNDHEEIAQLYRGRFLAPLLDVLTPELELFADEVQEVVRRVAGDALIKLAARAEATFDWCRLEALGRDIIDLNAADRQTYERLLTALMAQGKHIDAARVVAAAKEWLGEDIPLPTCHSETPRVTDLSPFIGRVEEFSTCRRWWQEAKNQRGGLYAVAGEAGIGKTRLAEQVLRLAAIQGGATHQVRCFRNERRLAYSCAAKIATSLAGLIAKGRAEHVREGLSLLLPELVEDPGEVRRQLSGTGAADRALLSAFAQLLVVCAGEKAAVLFIDDLQWADAASLELLCSLAAHLSGLRLMVLGAYRTDELRTPHLASFVASTGGRLELAGLRPSECVQLAEAVGGPPQEMSTSEAVSASDGNPFLLLEILQSAAVSNRGSAVPEGVAGLVQDKWSRLTAPARQLAQAASVLEEFATATSSRRMVGIGSVGVVRALEELHALGLIVEGAGNTLAFRHELVREVVYRNIPVLVRRALHARAVAVLKAHGKVPAAVVAIHAFRAAMRVTAFTQALRAAKDAMELGAYSEAEYFLQVARRSAPNVKARRAVAEAKLEATMYTGDIRRALNLSRKLRPYYEASGSERGLLTCEYCELQNDIAEGLSPLPTLEKKMSALVLRARKVDAGRLFVRALRDLSIVLLQSGKLQELSNLINSATSAAPQLDSMLRGDLHSIAAISLTFLGDYDAAVAAADEGVAAAVQGSDLLAHASSLTARGVVKMAGARLSEAEADYSRAMELMKVSGLPMHNALAINFGVLLIEQDRIQEALALYAIPELAAHRWRVVWHANMALACYEQGFTADAESAADKCVEIATGLGADWARIAGLSIRGLILLDRGDFVNGLHHFDEVEAAYSKSKYCVWDPTPMIRYVCRGLLARDQSQAALHLLQQEIDRVRLGNVFVENKLKLEQARALLTIDTAAALRITTEVEAFAQRAGAHLLARHAVGLREDIQLRLAG